MGNTEFLAEATALEWAQDVRRMLDRTTTPDVRRELRAELYGMRRLATALGCYSLAQAIDALYTQPDLSTETKAEA